MVLAPVWQKLDLGNFCLVEFVFIFGDEVAKLCVHRWEGSLRILPVWIWEARNVSTEDQVVLARAWCCHILSHNELWELPWWDLRCVSTSKLSAWGADVILAHTGDVARGSKPTRAVGTHGSCSLLPKTISGKQGRALYWLFRPQIHQLMPSMCFPKDLYSQVSVLSMGLHPGGCRWKGKAHPHGEMDQRNAGTSILGGFQS